MSFLKDKPTPWYLGRILGLVIALVMLARFATFAVAQTVPATLVSDKDDYAPYEIATLTGAGFWPGEPIDLSISIDDPATGSHVADYAWTQFNADGNGGFILGYEIPREAAGMTLVATAIGLNSGLVAKVLFTDSHFTLDSFNISVLGNNTDGWSVKVDATIGGGAPLADITRVSGTGIGNNQNLSLVTSTVNTRSFSSTFPANCGTTYALTQVQTRLGSAEGGMGGHNASFKTFDATNTAGLPVEVTTGNCPTLNQAPVITPLNPVVDLGPLPGCLAEDCFSATVDVAYAVDGNTSPVTVYATFSRNSTQLGDAVAIATVTDADGDPLTIGLPSPSSVKLIGPGVDSVIYTVNITADDGKVAFPASADVDITVNATIVYNFYGLLNPLKNGMVTNVKQGSAVPVKFQLFDCNNIPITSGNHTIAVYYQQGAVPNGDVDVDDSGSSNDNGINFRYSDPNWIYNLKTNSTYSKGSTYKIKATLDDTTTHEALISIK